MIVDTVKCYFDAPAAVTSSQWRLRLPQGSIGWDQPNIQEIEMHSTIGGADQCEGGTADASSEYSPTYNAGNAFDDDLHSFAWAPATGNAESWIRYTAPSDFSVAEFTVEANWITAPKQIILERWDGISWIGVFDSGTIPSWDFNELKTFTV